MPAKGTIEPGEVIEAAGIVDTGDPRTGQQQVGQHALSARQALTQDEGGVAAPDLGEQQAQLARRNPMAAGHLLSRRRSGEVGQSIVLDGTQARRMHTGRTTRIDQARGWLQQPSKVEEVTGGKMFGLGREIRSIDEKRGIFPEQPDLPGIHHVQHFGHASKQARMRRG